MSISSARLLAYRCCIFLLLSLAFITKGTPIRTTPAASSVKTDDNSSYLGSSQDKCQFNLTDSSQSLEVESSLYQHRGFSQCEYIIQAPSSRFILLNFTDIHSQFDMLVEPSVWRHHFVQEATETTTATESSLINIPHRKPLSDEENVNITDLQLHRLGELVSADVGNRSEDLNPSQIKSVHNSNNHNTSVLHKHNSSVSHTKISALKEPSSGRSQHHKDLSREILTNNISVVNTSTETRTENYSDLNTASVSSFVDIQTEVPIHNCSLKLIIEEVNETSGTHPQVICWGKSWRKRIPIVLQYSVPIRITYVWDRRSHSGFSLDFSFLRPEETDCLFRCNKHLCLPKKQLCDGYIDCPDRLDEDKSACTLTTEQKQNGEPSIIKLVIILISVTFGIIIVLALVFMISHSHCHGGAHQGGGSLLQPPHSHSSEVCRSPSGSMQESGQYEALLNQPQRQTTPAFVAANSRCLEHQQLLQQHQVEVEHKQQRYYYHTGENHCAGQHQHSSYQERQLQPICSNAEGAVPLDKPHVNRPLQHQQHLQHRCVHHLQQQSEQHLQQQRQCKKTHRYVSPSELYPPNIPLSADGEEGYARSQKSLHSKQQLERNWQVENEVFRPPPNKTVYDRDSPPPPYSLNPPGAKSLDSLVPSVGVVCVLRQARSSDGSPTGVPRSHSLSCHR